MTMMLNVDFGKIDKRALKDEDDDDDNDNDDDDVVMMILSYC